METSDDQADLAAAFSGWKGRRTVRADAITARLIEHFSVTLAPCLAPGAVPPGLFWCLAPDAFEAGDLGADGHPRTGIVLPAVPYPRRMWAGGALLFHGEFHPGDEVVKTSVVDDITFKAGGSGRLCFVTVRHLYEVGGRPIVEERQDIVYRQMPGQAARMEPPGAGPAARPAAAHRRSVEADPVLLFRYSALTFNGHRIHYDHPYATGVEGYAGLVVHGPLQATLMLNLATEVLGRLPRRFAYRGLAPLICGPSFFVEADMRPQEGLETAIVSASGTVTMSGTAEP